MNTIDPAAYRQVLGQYPTGVAVVTACGADGEPIGMTVGSFTSVSLDPPLVAFLPDQRSSSWHRLRDSGEHFCVNILSARQEDVCRQVATRREDKFKGIDWERSPGGHPVISGAVAFIDCTIETIHNAGDHHIVVGRVHHLETRNSHLPLLFFRGGYGSFSPVSLGAADADLVGQMRLVDLVRPALERVATRTSSEVSAICLVGDELVVAASAGQERSAEVPTRVGQRWPFAPPMGPVFAAWGEETLRARWLRRLTDGLDDPGHAEWFLSRILEDGYALSVTPDTSGSQIDAARLFRGGELTVTTAQAKRVLSTETILHNPLLADLPELVTLRTLSVPVFAPSGQVACSLTQWGPEQPLPLARIEAYVDLLLAAAGEASGSLRTI